jgi:hypothetical protein
MLVLALVTSTAALTPWRIVNRTGLQTTQRNLRVFTCQGLYSRNESTAVYTINSANDLWWLQATGGAGTILPGYKCMTEAHFLATCLITFPRFIRYNATAQQELLPLMSTIAGVLDAIPLEDDAIQVFAAPAQATCVFDAVTAFAGLAAAEATALVFDRWGNLTTGVAKSNPGWRWDSTIRDTFRPTLSGSPESRLVDYVVKRKLFNFFLKDGCIPFTKEHALLERMLANSPWRKPLVVFGYDNTHPLFGGDLFEAETTCSKEHSMGQVASAGVTNLAYFSSGQTRRSSTTHRKCTSRSWWAMGTTLTTSRAAARAG